ncbi:MAG: hypothetical protein ILA34_07295 [Bacteroidaceae bacterium]|nr:hypothetical protein [Bacteroidaceae bacterium]
MSDGNFNRALLPANSYRSGMKVGASMERRRCEAALLKALESCMTDPAERERIYRAFQERLRER